jgi:hypothetical protein
VRHGEPLELGGRGDQQVDRARRAVQALRRELLPHRPRARQRPVAQRRPAGQRVHALDHPLAVLGVPGAVQELDLGDGTSGDEALGQGSSPCERAG